MGGILNRTASRRKFLAGAAATAGAAVTLGVAGCDPTLIRRITEIKASGTPHHRMWVWEFTFDGPPWQIASDLAANGMGIVLKTHDGVDWMSTWDHTPDAVTGPGQVRTLANYFEDAGVPFHTWCVPTGVDPAREARMAADVLAAGARTLTLDLEAGAGFWRGSADDARRLGDELRRIAPFAPIDLSIDPRPWRMVLAPLNEFVAFTDAIAPQLYWQSFASQANIDGYRYVGLPPPPEGITPEFLLDVTARVLAPYDRPILPMGQGAAGAGDWSRFIQHGRAIGMGTAAVWRYGVMPGETLSYLGANRAVGHPQPPAAAAGAQP